MRNFFSKFFSKKSANSKVYRGEERRVNVREDSKQLIDSLLSSVQIKSENLNKELKLIPRLKLDNIEWNKQTILIMDDEELVNFFLEDDLTYFTTIANKQAQAILYNKSELDIINLAEKYCLKDFLLSFDKSKYDVISVTGDYAAFAIRRQLAKIKRVDYAILDISLGGSLNSLDGNFRECLNGIDIASDLYSINNEINLMIYTGNDLGKYSLETKQFNKLLPNSGSLFDHIVNKDTSLIIRRIKFLSFLANRKFTDLEF